MLGIQFHEGQCRKHLVKSGCDLTHWLINGSSDIKIHMKHAIGMCKDVKQTFIAGQACEVPDNSYSMSTFHLT